MTAVGVLGLAPGATRPPLRRIRRITRLFFFGDVSATTTRPGARGLGSEEQLSLLLRSMTANCDTRVGFKRFLTKLSAQGRGVDR